MECFLDVKLRPDPEFVEHLLLNALFAKLHLALVEDNSAGIAICFPGHQTSPPSLGACMRLLGSRQALQALARTDWLGGLRDHVKVSELAKVPLTAAHRKLRRVQAKSSPERLRRRLMKRHSLDGKQAHERIPDSAAEILKLPFVQVRSFGTGQTFRLFLHLDKEEVGPLPGRFNAYGLSQDATIPWF